MFKPCLRYPKGTLARSFPSYSTIPRDVKLSFGDDIAALEREEIWNSSPTYKTIVTLPFQTKTTRLWRWRHRIPSWHAWKAEKNRNKNSKGSFGINLETAKVTEIKNRNKTKLRISWWYPLVRFRNNITHRTSGPSPNANCRLWKSSAFSWIACPVSQFMWILYRPKLSQEGELNHLPTIWCILSVINK